ncbi:MAG: hypothetical protein E5Y74_10555, partial [Mesorhizobium sp.]
MESAAGQTHLGVVRATRNSSQGHATRRTEQRNTGVTKMTKIALTAAAILVATGTAFAGSDNYGSY